MMKTEVGYAPIEGGRLRYEKSGEGPTVVFLHGFGVTTQRGGYKLNYIYPDDYGVHFYGNIIFATDNLIATNPELLTRFLRATLKGWAYVIKNTEEVGRLVLKYKPDSSGG